MADVVAVTGAASGLGRLLVERLAERTDLGGLIGVDATTARVDGVVWRVADLGDPRLAERLRGVTVLVHLAAPDEGLPPAVRRAVTLEAARAVLEAGQELGARVVLCTSADVYPVADDPTTRVRDDAPLRQPEHAEGVVADHLAVEQLAAAARQRGVEVVVLRPAPVVGLPPALDGHRLRQLAGPRLLAVRGVEPVWQLCHVEDLVTALELAVGGVLKGDLGVAAEGALPQAVVESVSGRRRLELPAAVARSTAERLQRLGAQGSPHELDHVLGHLVLACDGLQAAGWAATWTNEAALEAHLGARGSDGRSVAYTAAGATVALLGTAALVRQARRRRRG